MGKATMKRTAQSDGNAFNWTNGRTGGYKRGGLIEVVDEGNGTVRIDVYQSDPGVRVNVSTQGADDYTQVLGKVTAGMLGAERRSDTHVTEEEFRWAALKALGVCEVTGKVDCAERSCELHYMGAPLKLAPAIDRKNYEGGQIGRVLDAGADPETGGEYHLKVSGNGAESKWLSVREDQVYALATVLGATDEAPAAISKRQATREHLEADKRAAERRLKDAQGLVRTAQAMSLDAQRDAAEAQERLFELVEGE